MLGYISSTRKKSCNTCVKSKRRCDLGYPFCKRCFIKGIDCVYPNAAPRETRKDVESVPVEVVIRQTTPDFTTPVVDSTTPCFIDPLLFPPDTSSNSYSSSSSSSLSPEGFPSLQIPDGWAVDIPPHHPQPTLTRMLVPELANPNFLTDAQTLYIVHSLCDFIPSMAYTGSTIFLHNSLYTTHQPQAYQDCVAICALYLAKTPRNKHILATSIAAKILQLAASSSTWSLTEHLAAVQSLIIYQAIRLFDPGLALQSAAQMQNPLLEVWAAHLWKRAFNENPSFASDHDCWIFYESLRRTIIMSVFTRCGWSCYSKGGLADQVPVLARLPLTKDFGAWSCDGEGWEGREGLCGGSKVVNYADFVGTWTSGCDLGDLDAFGKLLLAACVGDLDPRLLV